MKNTLGDLNNHLFMQLERLTDEDMTEEDLEKELKRSKAVIDIADGIIKNGALVLEGQKFLDGKWNADASLPTMLEGGKDNGGKKA